MRRRPVISQHLGEVARWEAQRREQVLSLAQGLGQIHQAQQMAYDQAHSSQHPVAAGCLLLGREAGVSLFSGSDFSSSPNASSWERYSLLPSEELEEG